MNRPAVYVIRIALAVASVAVVSMGGMVATNLIARKQAEPHRNERRIVEPNRKAAAPLEPSSPRL